MSEDHDDAIDHEAPSHSHAPHEGHQPPQDATPPKLPRRRERGRRLTQPSSSPSLTYEQRLLVLGRRSGLPAGDFAPLVGLSRFTLYEWKRRFLKFMSQGAEVVVGSLHGGGVDLEDGVEVLLGSACDVCRVASVDAEGRGGLVVQNGYSAEMSGERHLDEPEVVVGRDGDAAGISMIAKTLKDGHEQPVAECGHGGRAAHVRLDDRDEQVTRDGDIAAAVRRKRDGKT